MILCLSHSIMGSDRKALPVLILMTVFLFSGSPSFTSGSRARVTVPRIEEAQSPASPRPSAAPGPAVQLVFKEQHVVLDNGILQVTLSNPEGSVTGIQYNGIDNVLEVENGESNRGYWDVVWSAAGTNGTKGKLDRLEGTKLEVIVENEDQVELSFTRTWNFSLSGTVVPINVDKRFVLLRGSSGLYTYAVYEHLAEWPAFIIDNTRTVFKLRKDKFHYMAMADNRQRYMPLPDDREAPRGQALAYPEAVRLVDPMEPEFKGEVDDKYQYSCESKDISVHGWISSDPPTGFWQITPSIEFRSGGPTKQFLTSHVGPTSLNVFLSAHYSGEDLVMKFGPDEPWKKVFGPVFVYLNSLMGDGDPTSLWEDAKQQFIAEEQKWPYSFPASEDFMPADQRGKVSGRLLVLDRYSREESLPATGAYVGLSPTGEIGSWQRETKGYQFWTRADVDGLFSITNIRPGDYNLFAWVPGFMGDYKYQYTVTISPGLDIDLSDLIYKPPRNGPTFWEIGVPDRTAAEFYVPDPNPLYINKLYINHPDRFRQYGLWERYAELYPDGDLVYHVGSSDYRKDWFFTQVTRKRENNTYEGTTWQIKFMLEAVNISAAYTLQVALATAHVSELQIRFNNPDKNPPLFTTGIIGKDNTIARHGIHGLYWNYTITVPGTELAMGENTIFLTQTKSESPFQGVMYDYIRFEGPSYDRPNHR
ncbi:uncharacterized protein LOC116202656 isoform X2 [Punica granatum]|uniref:rhamnogalacturonan endolyase n=3 Tax=Punica granatum TaxID=22663 RepID=A0A6P8D979_PUNGR|nr:uncharacterized protein LOC116202656 isoform X2 [Punica granatum]